MIKTTDTQHYKDIANAIRMKGGEGLYKPEDMAEAIMNIPTEGEAEPLTVRKNGTYTREFGYSPVSVNVPQYNHTQHGSHVVDGKWVRPEEWPDIESLPLDDEDGTIYYTYDTDCDLAWISIKNTTTGSGYKNNYRLGYIENGQFVAAHESLNVGYNTQYTYMFTDEDKALSRYWVLKYTGRVKTPTFASWSWTNPEATTARSLVSTAQPCVEMYGDMPYATSFASTGSNRFLESVYIKTSGALTSCSAMFSGSWNLQRVKRDSWDTSNVTTFASMFDYCFVLEDIDLDFSGMVTSKCTSIATMFRYCFCLFGEIDVSDWDTTNVTTIAGIFYYLMNVTKIIGIEDWYLPNCNTVYASSSYLFGHMYSLEGDLDLSHWELGKTATFAANGTSFSSLFTYARKIKKIDISTWDLSMATSVASLFAYCESLEEIKMPDDIGSGGKLTTISSMFNYCRSLKKADISMIDLTACTSITSLCNYCESLTEFVPPTTAPLGSSANTTAASLFAYCHSLEEVDLSWYDCADWNYATPVYSGLVGYCRNLKTLIPFVHAEKSFSVADCVALSRSSLVALFNACNNKASGTQTLTIGTTNWAKLSDEDIAIITDKGWTLK